MPLIVIVALEAALVPMPVSTYAVVANCVLLLPCAAVGAAGTPVNVGLPSCVAESGVVESIRVPALSGTVIERLAVSVAGVRITL